MAINPIKIPTTTVVYQLNVLWCAFEQRAMGELQNLRGQVAKKDKEIQASAAKQKKMMAMVAAMKQQHATELEKLKLKAGDGA